MATQESESGEFSRTLDDLVTLARTRRAGEIFQLVGGIDVVTEKSSQDAVKSLRETGGDVLRARNAFVKSSKTAVKSLPVTDVALPGTTVIKQTVDESVRGRFQRHYGGSAKPSRNAFMADFQPAVSRFTTKNVFAKGDVIFHPIDQLTAGISGSAGEARVLTPKIAEADSAMAKLRRKISPGGIVTPPQPKAKQVEAAMDVALTKGLKGADAIEEVVSILPDSKAVLTAADPGKGGITAVTGRFGDFASKGARKLFSFLPVAGALVDASYAYDDIRKGDYGAAGGHIGDALIGIIPPADMANLVIDLQDEPRWTNLWLASDEDGGVVSGVVRAVEGLELGGDIADTIDSDGDGDIDIF